MPISETTPDAVRPSRRGCDFCAPQYTESARRARIEGTVVLYVRIYPDGKARVFRVQRSLSRDLDEKAIEAVRSWRFSPGKKDGKTIIAPATIEVNFRLADPSEPCREGPAQIEAAGPQAAEGGPKEAVASIQVRPRSLSFEHGDLLP